LWNSIGALSIVVWNGTLVGTVCFILKKLNVLRVSENCEIIGLDNGTHYDPAYVGGIFILNKIRFWFIYLWHDVTPCDLFALRQSIRVRNSILQKSFFSAL